MWNLTSSDPDLLPTLNVTNQTSITQSKQVRAWVDINGLMSNSKTNGKMVGSSAWMSYPISLYDATKMNFSMFWSNQSCPISVNSPQSCSPQGGFALVFQQESQTALGEYKNNLGEGLGYDSLSGVLAIEFDMMSSNHNDQPLNRNLMLSVQVRNSNTKLLSTKVSSSLSKNFSPINFANFNQSDFQPRVNVSVGLIPNQINQEMLLVMHINGITQIQTRLSFKELGIDPNKMYYVGFTSAQNLNPMVATGTLSILNFRIFKTKPKFVDGQVSYLYDFTDSRGNQSLLEVRSSFYDLCMQKTTMIVYPTFTIDDQLQGKTPNDTKETEPRILAFVYNRDSFVLGSNIQPLNKPQFYRPSILYMQPDVKFQMSIPAGRTQIRMGFYWGQDLIMNITAIDYFRQQQSTSFAFIVIENSDLITGTLSVKGYANNNYQFNIFCYDKSLNPASVPFSTLQLAVTSEYIRLNDTDYSNVVPATCYGVIQSQNAKGNDLTRNNAFTCTFLPNVNGTYFINSPYLPSGRSFKVEIGQVDQVTKILSSEYSLATVMGDFAVYVGAMIEIKIDLRDYLNNEYKIPPEESCTFTKSFFTQNGQKYSFLFYDGFPYLRTQISTSGVADFKITISCSRIEFDLQCFRCQKIIMPLPEYFYYKMVIPAYPSQYDISLNDQSTVMLPQGSSLAIDINFFDRYDNMIQTELSDSMFNDIKASFIYFNRTQKRTFNLTKVQVPGRVMLSLSDVDNLFFKQLPPRANTYFIEIQVPSQQACNTLDKYSKGIYLVTSDKFAPIESVGEQDQNRMDPNMISFTMDKIVTVGKVAKLAFTLRNPNFMQMNAWPTSTITDLIDANITDASGVSVKSSSQCSVKFNFGLYEGEYLGWLLCYKVPARQPLTLRLLYGSPQTPTQQQTLVLQPFTLLAANASTAERTFSISQSAATSAGLDLQFRLYDAQGNQVDNIMIDREQAQLSVITYNISRIDSAPTYTKVGVLPMWNSSAFFRIDAENLVIGTYRVTLNTAERPISAEFSTSSNSQRISPEFSWALREGGWVGNNEVQVNSFIGVRFYARNIHNQTIDSFSDAQLVNSQVRVYILNSAGQIIHMSLSGTAFDALQNGLIFYNFTSTEPVRKNAKYQCYAYFQDIDQYLFVQNGTFTVNDRFDPLQSEMYLIKGIDQREYRMIPYQENAGLDNSFNATHYDPRFDGSMRFKLYLRTNLYNEIVRDADFSTTNFYGAYLASVSSSIIGFQMQTNLTSIQLKITNFNNESLLVTPASWSDQDAIERLKEGYYFIYIQGTQLGANPFTLQWMFSLFNSENDPDPVQTSMNFYAPRFVNVTAGEPFTFTVAAYGNKAPKVILVTHVNKGVIDSVEIDSTSDNNPAGYVSYVTVMHSIVGLYQIQLRVDPLPVKTVTIQVNPGPLHTIKVTDGNQIVARKVPTGTQISYNFTLVDRYGNNIYAFGKDRPSLSKISDLVQIVHWNRDPIQRFIRPISSSMYQVNFTTQYAGVVGVILPFQQPVNQGFYSQIINITFETNPKNIPSIKFTNAQLRQREIQAGTFVQLEIKMFDENSNILTSITNPQSLFVVNVVADAACNTSTLLMTFLSSSKEVLVYQANITKVCQYNVIVHYFSPVDGDLIVPCLNCFIRVTPAAEEYRRFEFLDARDMMQSFFTSPTPTLFINKYDWNPKLIMVMRDIYGNLVTTRTGPELSFNYTIDLVSRDGRTLLRNGIWDQFRSFHMISFCPEDTIINFCMQQEWTIASLRIRQVNKQTNREVGKVLINVQFVDNLGVFYNSDSINPLGANYTYMKIFNQDASDVIGHDIAVIPERCIGGDQFPIIGRIELRTLQGFRINDTFANFTKRLSIKIQNLNETNYQGRFYPGNTQGSIIFTLFVKDDFTFDQNSAIARLYIDGQLVHDLRQIVVQCEKRMNYNKYFSNITSNSTQFQTRFDPIPIVRAGEDFTLNLTGLIDYAVSPPDAGQFLPYDRAIFANYTNGQIPVVGSELIEVANDKVQMWKFQMTRAGQLNIVGSGIPDNFQFNVTVVPNLPNAIYTLVTIEQQRMVAGTNATIWVSLADQYGNFINITNTASDLQYFNNYTQLFYAKLSDDLLLPDQWQLLPAQSCFDVQPSTWRVRCSIPLITKGLYKFRVLVRGEPVTTSCVNCYVRVTTTGKFSLARSVVSELSQNYLSGTQSFVIGKFAQFPRQQFLYFKIAIKDEFDNLYMHEDLPALETLAFRLSNSTNDINLAQLRIANGKSDSCYLFKITIQQTTNQINSFALTREGQYSLRVIGQSLGTFNFPLYIKENKNNPNFVAQMGASLQLRTRDSPFSARAGIYSVLQFGIFSSDYLLNSTQASAVTNLNQVQLSNPLPQARGVLENGPQLVGQYRGIYEKLYRFSNVQYSTGGYLERFTATINGFDQVAQTQFFQTQITPGPLKSMQITRNYGSLTLSPVDDFQNAVDPSADPAFLPPVPLTRSQTPRLQPQVALTSWMSYRFNMSSKTGEVRVTDTSIIGNLATVNVWDPVQMLWYNQSMVATNNTQRVVDVAKSRFTIARTNLTAGQSQTIRVQLVDQLNQAMSNSSVIQDQLVNLQVRFSFAHQSLSEYGRRVSRWVNFSTSTFVNGAFELQVPFNKSGYYFIEVRYYDQEIQQLYSAVPGILQWFFVDVNPDTGVSKDQQWTLSLTAVAKNRIFTPLSTPSSQDYVTLMKAQPLFFIARLGDKFGNPFLSPEIYDFYNVGDTALSSRIRNQADKHDQKLNTRFIWNFLTLSAYEQLNRGLYKQYEPSYYPLVNNEYYDQQKSYKLDVYSPSNSTTSNVNLKVVYLVIDSDQALDRYQSVNVTISRELNLGNGGLFSPDFDQNQFKVRNNTKNLLTLMLRNDDGRPYLAEQVLNFTLELRNTSNKFVNISGKNTSVPGPLDTVKITIIPYMNEAFYRVLITAVQLYQDVPLVVGVKLQTRFKYNLTPAQQDMGLWVFPQVPPNFLNNIQNTSFLLGNSTKFSPATKVSFRLELRYNGTTYMNDMQSARRIRVYRGGAIEMVNAQLVNKTTYTVSVNLEGPKTNYFRIYYQDANGALYPLISPDVIAFEIGTANNQLLKSTFSEDFDSFYYPKLGLPYSLPILQQQQQFDPSKVKLILLSNLVPIQSATLQYPLITQIYSIGNALRLSILAVDTQTSRCLSPQDYSPYRDLRVALTRVDPLTGGVLPLSVERDSLQMVQKVVSSQTSYCTYYSIAVLESQDQLNQEGFYAITVTYLPSMNSTNVTFQALIPGIDFTKTAIGWYQQPLSTSAQSTLIADFAVYEEFNYLLYFRDVQGSYVSDRQQPVRIQIKFDQQQLTEEKDYRYIARYDDRFKGYLITIVFYRAGSYQAEYYFNLQRAGNIEVKNGPILFVVREPLCTRVSILSVTPSNGNTHQQQLQLGQPFTLVFHCFDLNGNEITTNIDQLQAKAVFTNQEQNDLQTFAPVDALQNGIYRVSMKFYIEGLYTVKIYFNSMLIYADATQQYRVLSDLCRSPSTNQLLYRCPNSPSTCANTYHECQYVNPSKCKDSQPFVCGQESYVGERCVANMPEECCRVGGIIQPGIKWCPHTNRCYNTTRESCPSDQGKYLCKSRGGLNGGTWVDNRTECCEDFSYNVTRTVEGVTTVVSKPMVKCSSEDKCVPEDTAEFCFFSFKRHCPEIFGQQYSYQCPNDGRCRRSPLECPSPRVCPPGYTQCPDYTCLRGLDKFNQCSKLQNCTKTLPDGSVIDYIRCPDGSCQRTYEECPSQVSCMIPGQVVCPDGSCKDSEYQCVQPNECTSDKPYRCPGFPSTCAQNRESCPLPSAKSCGGTLSLCANGECSAECKESKDYFTAPALAKINNAISLQSNCSSLGMVQCPNYECRRSYIDCSDILYCPAPTNYTYSPSAIVCPGVQMCALSRYDCTYSSCESTLNNRFLPSKLSYDQLSVTQTQLQTCYDGRCFIFGRQKQQVCMTPISCSSKYIKTGGFGEFCISNTNLSTSLMELSMLLSDFKCSGMKVKCVTGECRNSIDDCPSQITCPDDYPIQCRDGQCAKSKVFCENVDFAVEQNIVKCQTLGFMLCTSDLITCASSQSKCPSRSSCPPTFIKCWDESCVDVESGQSCPPVTNTLISQRSAMSTCPDQFSYPFHCFSDGSCRASLEDCPSISFCPPERPVKCAADNSCRKSIKNCPRFNNCPEGYRFCSGEGTCVQNQRPCGTPITCAQHTPFKCEDGTCVEELTQCFKLERSLPSIAQQCLEDETNYLCQNNKTRCTQNLFECSASSACVGSHLVKAHESLSCFDSRISFHIDFIEQADTSYSQCYLQNMYKCQSDGRCSETPCQEWQDCPDNQVKCWDGSCVNDLKVCKNLTNGCPIYAPIKCIYTARCVSDQTQCEKEETVKSIVQASCQTKFGLQVACPYDGSCSSSLSNCPTSPPKCPLIFPNTVVQIQTNNKCFVQVCPEQMPYKCQSGLCVSQKEDCPINPFSFEDIQYCQLLSTQTGLNLFVPCGNGQCAERSDQCQPLYECSLNLNSVAFIRCPDGTCKQSASQCPQYISSKANTTCPSHIPFLCANGMCVKSSGDCLKNDNGCPQKSPFKCPQTGQCVAQMKDCQNPYALNAQMFLFPNYIPPMSSTPLIAVYGKTRSICQAKGQFTCRVGNELPYCVDRLDDCISVDNNCPINSPIRCGNKCLKSYTECIDTQIDNCTALSTMEQPMLRCPATSLTSSPCQTSLNLCQTEDGCSIMSQPFKCFPQFNKKTQCSALPFTSVAQFTSQACKTSDRALNTLPTASLECMDQETPQSCADGSCVANLGQCPTCIYYCASMRKCVSGQFECIQSNAIISDQTCPMSAPIRCITTGKCVSEEIECAVEYQKSVKISQNRTFSGGLINEKCPVTSPLRCQDGRCVSQYDQCIALQRARFNNTLELFANNPYNQPIKWGDKPNLASNSGQCQVICMDGSCRDKVENCPLIDGCYDMSRPYRCRSGFCARDKDHCLQLFEEIEDYDYDNTSFSCNTVIGDRTAYKRCEDGTCRPLKPIIENETGSILSLLPQCLPYMGCPVEQPFHCPSGECASSLENCAGFSQCPIHTPFRCKNFHCVKDISQCDRPYSTYKALQMEVTFDPYLESEVDFAYDSDGFAIGRLEIPSGTLVINVTESPNIQTQQQLMQKMQIYPVPTSILDLVLNRISESRVDYVSRIYSLQDSKYLARAHTLISPAVKLALSSNHITQASLSTSRYLEENDAISMDEQILQRPLYIQFKYDKESFPEGILDLRNDLCLARAFHMQNLYSNDTLRPQWECQQRDFTLTKDGFLRYSIDQLGIYAVIVNPAPDVTPDMSTCTSWVCLYHIPLHLVFFAALLLLSLLIYLIAACCRTQSKQESLKMAEERRLKVLMAQQNESFHSVRAQKANMPAYITQEEFNGPSMSERELNVDKVKEVLDRIDTSEVPLMPGQVVQYMVDQHELQRRQIEELKVQLQEQNEREKENLKLIKRIFHRKQLIYEQMQVQSDLRSQSMRSQSRRKKRREAINDPSIKKEYEDIEQYLSQILSETHMPEAQDPKASTATFQQFPGVNTLRIKPLNPGEQSTASLQPPTLHHAHDQTAAGGGVGQPLITESTRNLMLQQQHHTQSATDLEIRESRLKRKAADMLLKRIDEQSHAQQEDMGDGDNMQQYYEERVAQEQDRLASQRMQQPPDITNASPNQNRYASKGLGQQPPLNATMDNDNPYLDDPELQGLDPAALNKTLNQLFSRALQKGSSGRQKNMLMSGGEVAGSVSGNLLSSRVSKGLSDRLQASIGKHSAASNADSGQKKKNGRFEGEESEQDSDDNLMLYDDYERRKQSKHHSKQPSHASSKHK